MTRTSTFRSFDGTKIAYRVAGGGREVLLCFNGIGVEKWAWQPLTEFLDNRFTIVTWDYRGHGESGKPHLSELSFDHLVRDGLDLIQTLKIRKATLLGHSSGFHVALEVLQKKPKLVRRLISCLGSPGLTLDHFLDSFVGQVVFDIGYILNALLPTTAYGINRILLSHPLTYYIGAMLRLVNPAIEGKEGVKKYLSGFAIKNFSNFGNLMSSESKKDGRVLLSKINVPTLIIASEDDRFVPLRIAEEMHQKIKNSELFTIRGGTHAALFEQPDIFNLVIEKFLFQRSLLS